jgi:hypothetical protein
MEQAFTVESRGGARIDLRRHPLAVEFRLNDLAAVDGERKRLAEPAVVE